MKKFLRIIQFLFIGFLFSGTYCLGQEAVLKGIVSDDEAGETLIGVNILSEPDGKGTITDVSGSYKLKLTPGKHKVSFSYVGYEPVVKEIELEANQTLYLDVSLGEGRNQLDMMVVSSSQYQKRIAEETVSIDVVSDYLIENTNTVTLWDAVEKVPGVNIVDGQATIRGGSGYAYGTGSRVQVLVDDMPMLTGDFAEVRWEFIPMENAEQIEVIKGAASVLYGSSALNGVISVQTGYAKSEPETTFTLFNGFYANPRNKLAKWWDTQPNFTGGSFSHRQKIKRWDIITGANFNLKESYLKEGNDNNFRFNVKTRYIPAKIEGLSLGLNANMMYQHAGRFFLYNNALESPYEGASSEDRYTLATLDPHLTYFGDRGVRHKLKSRYYSVIRWRESGTKSQVSNLAYLEYQFQKRFDFGLAITSGMVGNFIWGYNNTFNNGDKVATYSGGGYAQAEYKIGKLNLVAGMRYEASATDKKLLDTIQVEQRLSPFVMRFGLNYEIAKQSFLRLSYGQGFRSPSLVERFIQEELPFDIGIPLQLFPNPQLRPEKGWNAELGIKQGLDFGNNWGGYVDFAVFWTEIDDMTEFVFGNYGPDGGDPEVGFKTVNLDGARIAGFEISTSMNGSVGKFPFRVYGGYTYSYPADLEIDSTQRKLKPFMENFFKGFSNPDSVQTSILKYRFRHVARLDVETDISKKLIVGANVSFSSPFDKVDYVFEQFIGGYKEWAELNPKGALITDARISYRASDLTTFTFVAKNIFNKEYSLRPGITAAPANFAIQCRVRL